jgi:hypothetical protein
MRKIVAPILLLLLVFWLFGQEYNESMEAPFEQVKVVGNIRLILVPSEKQALEFEADQDLEGLTVESNEGELFLKTKSDLKKEPPLKGKLFYRVLNRIEVSKGAHVQSADTLKTEILLLKAETGGKAELRVLTDSLSVRINQGADVILYGKTRAQSVNAYTWGNYLSYDLEVVNTFVKAATGAQVKVKATGLLDANATSKATVGYWGEPQQKKIKTSVGGEVIQLTE